MFDRSYAKGILPKRLQAYMQQAEADLKITEMNLKDKTLSRSSLGAKWCRYSFEEERYKKKIEQEIDSLREQVKQKLYNQKKQAISNNNPSVDKIMGVQAEKILITTDEYKELKAALKEQEDIIRLILEIQKQVSMFGYDLKTAVDVIKLENI